MSRQPQLTEWKRELTRRFPDLPTSTAIVLALYSMGLLLAHVSGLTTVAWTLSRLYTLSYDATRKRLIEFYKEAPAKSGTHHGVKRRDFDVTTCFDPLLRWILSLSPGKLLPLAIDVTNLGERFHVLCISVVIRGCAIPVAWKVLPGGVEDPWNPHWQALLHCLKAAVPDGYLVIVLSDRGLESQELFRSICTLGWHPLMRIKKGAQFKPKGWGRFYPLHQLVGKVAIRYQAEGCVYKTEPLSCTLLARWDEGHAEPWFVLTDLPPENADAIWYALRTWIEQGFKVIKGGQWDWQKTRMEDAGRVERLWLVLAVATLWVVAVGVEEEVQDQDARERRLQERDLSETRDEARRRQEREANRRQKQAEAQQRRQERQQAQKEAREKARLEKRAKKKDKREEAVQTTVPEAATKPTAKPTRKKYEQARIHRVSRRGLTALEAAWADGRSLLPQHLHPEPWPAMTHSPFTLTEQEFLAQQTYT